MVYLCGHQVQGLLWRRRITPNLHEWHKIKPDYISVFIYHFNVSI
jgi:hypothetical protein